MDIIYMFKQAMVLVVMVSTEVVARRRSVAARTLSIRSRARCCIGAVRRSKVRASVAVVSCGVRGATGSSSHRVP